MFRLEALVTSTGLEDAISSLNALTHTSSNYIVDLTSMISNLLSLSTWALPLLLSYDVTFNEHIASFFTATLSSTARDYLDSSAHKLLDHLNTFYIHPHSDIKNPQLESHQNTIRLTHPVLEILSKPDFTPLNPDTQASGNRDLAGKSTQKRNRKVSRAIIFDFDEKPFRAIGVRWPRDQEEAHQLETDLLD